MTLRPSIVISPEVMGMSRLTSCIAVVLPLPDGPIRTQISLAGISRVRFETAAVVRPGYTLVASTKASGTARGPSDSSDSAVVTPPVRGAEGRGRISPPDAATAPHDGRSRNISRVGASRRRVGILSGWARAPGLPSRSLNVGAREPLELAAKL